MEELAFGVSQGEFGQARGQCAEEWVKQRVVWATGYSLGGRQKLPGRSRVPETRCWQGGELRGLCDLPVQRPQPSSGLASAHTWHSALLMSPPHSPVCVLEAH